MNCKKNIRTLISFILLSFLPAVYALTEKPASNDTAMQNAVLTHINEYRQQHGLAKLRMDPNLIREAKQHSIDMATHKMPFGHQGFANRISRAHTQIKNSGAGAENVAYNYKDARTVVQQWVRSPGHQRNIVGNYNLTGVGIARDRQGRIYYTQLFLRTGKSSEQRVSVRRPIWGVSFRRSA
jgi:uncharacterized protein YkwD